MVFPLKQLVLFPFLVSAAVFSTLTLPLALLGSKPVDIRLQEEPVFDGRLRDVATPYLGLASALSLGAGVATVALMGWRQSSLKSAQFEKQLAGLQQHLKEKEELLEELKLTESRLETSGLSMFLSAETESRNGANRHFSPKETAIESGPILVEMPVQIVEPSSIAQPVEVLQTGVFIQAVEPNRKAQTAASAFQSAQNFLSFDRANVYREPAAIVPTDSTTASLPVEDLQSQIKQLMTQIATLQNSLQTTPQLDPPEADRANPRHQTQVLESWLMHKVAS